jgi:hypothetical protein
MINTLKTTADRIALCGLACTARHGHPLARGPVPAHSHPVPFLLVASNELTLPFRRRLRDSLRPAHDNCAAPFRSGC